MTTMQDVRSLDSFSKNIYTELARLQEIAHAANSLEIALAHFAPGICEDNRTKLRQALDARYET